MLNGFIQKVSDRHPLTREEAAQAMEAMLSGEVSEIHLAAFLIALRTRGETAEELAGFLTVMREKMTRVRCDDIYAVDLCGTGGDGSNSFNLSTAAALVAAAGGVTVAKHGNRAVSSRSGSADFLQALGVKIDNNKEAAEAELVKWKFSFLFAPNYHPAAKAVGPVRRALGMRTVFNLLGPLANPASVKRQLVGVFHADWMEPVAETLTKTGSDHVMVIHGAEGLDEISAAGETIVCEMKAGIMRKHVLTPETIGVMSSTRAAIEGGTAEENARRFFDAAEGRETVLREWIVANAGTAFYLSDKAKTLADGASMAREVIASGRLRHYMDELLNESHG